MTNNSHNFFIMNSELPDPDASTRPRRSKTLYSNVLKQPKNIEAGQKSPLNKKKKDRYIHFQLHKTRMF